MNNRFRIVAGVICVLAGLLLNKWSLERVFAADEHLASGMMIVAIVLQQLAWLALGCGLLLGVGRRKRFRSLLSIPTSVHTRRMAGAGFLVVSLAGVSLGAYGMLRVAGVIDPHRELRRAYQEMVVTEQWIRDREPDLKHLGKSVLNLSLPDHRSVGLFAEEVRIGEPVFPSNLNGLKPGESGDSTSRVVLAGMGVSVASIPIEDSPTMLPKAEIQLWNPLLREFRYFERADFKFKQATVDLEAPETVESVVVFEGVGYLPGGEVVEVNAQLALRWRENAESESWTIDRWLTTGMEFITSPRKLFTETLEEALAEPATLAAARQSIHEELSTRYMLERWKPEGFGHVAVAHHPALAVVDVDRDGFDDFYLMARHGENRFFRNRGDGSFEEIAGRLGLNLDGGGSCGLFADFDNDGDLDVLLGRNASPCLLLRNDRGEFNDVSDKALPRPRPTDVTSISAADFDGDGLLDVALATYGGSTDGLRTADRTMVKRLRKEIGRPLNAIGPPTILLKNVGFGRFQRHEPGAVHLFRWTFQTCWSDFDRDGDQDLYVSNDSGPNNLLRNDGTGHFTDVTVETGTADVGFGMGTCWGDYDNDGWFDLYNTNMYSKAGLRITRKIPGLEARTLRAAHGNSLLKNRGMGPTSRGRSERQFEKVSGLTPPALLVEAAGWGWGGQFCDIDNDTYLDISALSGFFTAPKKVAKPGDT